MKLIILHHYSDGYTYSGVDTIPVERDSEGELIMEMKEWAKTEIEKDCYSFKSWKDTGINANTILDKDQYCSIEIMTFEKWWTSNVV